MLHIAVKELLPVLISSVIWGNQWEGHKVQKFCDNSAAMAAINSRVSKEKHMYDAYVKMFPGAQNKLADNLS